LVSLLPPPPIFPKEDINAQDSIISLKSTSKHNIPREDLSSEVSLQASLQDEKEEI
jgi:hypothetical protein